MHDGHVGREVRVRVVRAVRRTPKHSRRSRSPALRGRPEVKLALQKNVDSNVNCGKLCLKQGSCKRFYFCSGRRRQCSSWNCHMCDASEPLGGLPGQNAEEEGQRQLLLFLGRQGFVELERVMQQRLNINSGIALVDASGLQF